MWPTAASLREFLNSIEYGLDVEDDDDEQNIFPDLERMRKNMIDGLSSSVRRRHIRMLIMDTHKFAAFFDPRLKHLPFASTIERVHMHNEIERMVIDMLFNIEEENTLDEPAAGETASSSSQIASFGAEKYYRFEESAAAPVGEENDFRKKSSNEVKAYLSFRFTDGFSENMVKSVEFPLIFWRE